jgi:hypothetical protein
VVIDTTKLMGIEWTIANQEAEGGDAGRGTSVRHSWAREPTFRIALIVAMSLT